MSTITVRFHVTRDTPSEVQAQARQLIIKALAHFVTCRAMINQMNQDCVMMSQDGEVVGQISQDDVVTDQMSQDDAILIGEMLNASEDQGPA